MKNLHKAYYKDYFSKVDFSAADIDTKNNQDAIAAANATMTKAELFVIPAPIPELATFSCYISYPGLITGTGIAHETGIQGEFKLGLHFDYTYGMPVIYGSSVKGVLRNFFLDEYKEADAHIVLADIFDGIRNGKPKPIYERDVFFDAVVIEDNDGKLLETDAITPHSENGLKNPVPISFLKIAPGCRVEFRFKLVDSVITAKKKLELFKNIILTYGIGAKTNIGYGQLAINRRAPNQ